MNDNQGIDTSLATISEDGKVPKTRMDSPAGVQGYVRQLTYSDSTRSKKRALVNGLVDGNAPYNREKLRAAGRADACNVNFGQARAYMEAGTGAFYDLFTEAPSYITIKTSFGTEEQKSEWSRIITEEADRILRRDPVWDYSIQVSQWDMVLHGTGPLLFEDEDRVLPKAFLSGDLKLPEFTKSDTFFWESCAILDTLFPPQLYNFIENESAASSVGWDVEYTKKVIARAMNIKRQQGAPYQWEFYQQELKNNSLAYYDNNKIVKIAHVFWQEFDNRITHAIIEQTDTTGNEIKFLYRKVGRYENWQQAIHPMYFDHGNGGYHHSVTGLGIKMYAAMEYQNRLLCNLADKAFSPKVLFKPTSTEASQKFSIAHFGDYGILPSGLDPIQNPVVGLMEEGLTMHGAIQSVVTSNLSSYRQQPVQKDGNPITAKQVMYDASQQSALSKTQFNRYYEQLDMLYEEITRRLMRSNPRDDRAKEFQKRCGDRGVPKEAYKNIESVQATRVIGQGSAFVRKQSLVNLWGLLAPALPEDGRDHLIQDMIGAEAGQSAVTRYYPRKENTGIETDQKSEAMQWVGLMKTGMRPSVTSSQNPAVFATTYMEAASQALESLQQGANPVDVVNFLHIAGPAIIQQIQRLQADPTRKVLVEPLMEQWKQLATITDQLTEKVQKDAEQQQQQAEKTQQALTDAQLKQLQVNSDIQLKTMKVQAQLKQSEDRHQVKMRQSMQQLALNDAKAAADITLKSRSQTAQTQLQMREHAMNMAMKEKPAQSESKKD